MMRLALIGKKIAHSKSPEIYREISSDEIEYCILDIDSEMEMPSLTEIFKKFQGLSITSPYKRYFLDKVTVLPEFKKLNVINAIRKNGNQFEAINTDYLAITKILGEMPSKNIIVLGDGAMSSVVQQILIKLGYHFLILSRKKNGPLENLSLNGYFPGDVLVINSCSRDFIFRGTLPERTVFWDLNYNFEPHFNFFKSKNIKYVDGISLLKIQAQFALDFFRFST